MAAGKFSFMDIMNVQSKVEAVGTVDKYTEIYLSPYDVNPSESNFYSQSNIEELADSFLTVGQQQPTVLGRVNGIFKIISGHRRNLANILNIERGHEEYKSVRYLYRDMTEATFELSLLVGNAYNRELTPYEKVEQAKRLKAALIRAQKEDGLEIQGKLRDAIAEIMGESSTNIARMESINNNLTEEAKEEFKKGNIGITAAYEASKLPKNEQKSIAAAAAAGEDVRAKEIALKVAERTASKAIQDAQEAQDEAEKQAEETVKAIEKANEKQDVAEQKAAEAMAASKQAQIMRDWVSDSAKAATEAAAKAVLKVSETDTPQEEWSNTEWVVFMARAIMQQADKVSEDDLYLLHDIMIRCQNPDEPKVADEQIEGQQDISNYKEAMPESEASNEQ